MARKVAGASARVLRQVDASACSEHLRVQLVEHPAEPFGTNRQIERERPARHREGERAGVGGSEALEHRQERGEALAAEPLDHRADGRRLLEGHDELVLEESLRAVEAVPLGDAVEGVEETGHVFGVRDLVCRSLAVPGLVEGGDRERVEEAARRCQGDPRQRPWCEAWARAGSRRSRRGRSSSRAWSPRVSTERPSLLRRGLAVDPGHRVPVRRIAALHHLHDGVEIGGAVGVHQQVAGLDRDHLQRRGLGRPPRSAPSPRRWPRRGPGPTRGRGRRCLSASPGSSARTCEQNAPSR